MCQLKQSIKFKTIWRLQSWLDINKIISVLKFPFFSTIWTSMLIMIDFFIVVQVQLSPFSPHNATPHTSPISTSYPRTYPLWLCPCVLYTCSFMVLLLFSPIVPLPPPLWLLSVCSLFQCLWLYFACLFVCWLWST